MRRCNLLQHFISDRSAAHQEVISKLFISAKGVDPALRRKPESLLICSINETSGCDHANNQAKPC